MVKNVHITFSFHHSSPFKQPPLTVQLPASGRKKEMNCFYPPSDAQCLHRYDLFTLGLGSQAAHFIRSSNNPSWCRKEPLMLHVCPKLARYFLSSGSWSNRTPRCVLLLRASFKTNTCTASFGNMYGEGGEKGITAECKRQDAMVV